MLFPVAKNEVYYFNLFQIKYGEGKCTLKRSYIILDTDYDRYSAVFWCLKVGLNNVQYLWFLSRDQNLRPDIEARMKMTVGSYRVDMSKLMYTPQSSC